MKIKIALVIRGFHSGGIEKVFETYFSHMDLELYEIHVVTNMKNIPERQKIFEEMGCKVHAFSDMQGHRFKFRNIKEYERLFKLERFDIVHSNVPDNLFPLYFAKKNNVPLRILHAHNAYTDGFDKKSSLISWLYRKGFAFNVFNANCLLAVSQKAAKAAFADKSEKAVILKNAIDLEEFAFNQESRNKIRKQLGIQAYEILLGHVGRYENANKNQEFVLNLFKIILEKHSNCKLVMIGEGKRRQKFMDMAKELGIAEKTIFTGAILNVNEYLSAMDIFVAPSRKEGFMIAGIEAQTSGVKCILSDNTPEEVYVLKDLSVLPIIGKNALDQWVKQVEKLLPEILNRDVNDRFAALDQVRVAGFDINEQALSLKAIYQGFLCDRQKADWIRIGL